MTTTAPPTEERSGMAHDEARRVEPVSVRIVLFGGPRSGVTSTVGVLGDRLGQPVTATQTEGLSRSLDWLEYEGGRHDGRSIRTQVVGMSGAFDPTVASVLATADVVLFVADTTAAGLEPSMDALHALRSFTSARMAAPAVLYLANKRDEASALELEVVRSQLAVHDDESLLETSSLTGDGVRQAFVYAVREGLKRLAEGPRADGGSRTLDDLVRLVQDVPIDDPPVDGPGGEGPTGPVLDGEAVDLAASTIDGPDRRLRREHIGRDRADTEPVAAVAAVDAPAASEVVEAAEDVDVVDPLHMDDLFEEVSVVPAPVDAPVDLGLAHLPPPPSSPSPATPSAPAPRRRRWRRGS